MHEKLDVVRIIFGKEMVELATGCLCTQQIEHILVKEYQK